jgi:hypothetical protein
VFTPRPALCGAHANVHLVCKWTSSALQQSNSIWDA